MVFYVFAVSHLNMPQEKRPKNLQNKFSSNMYDNLTHCATALN